MNACACPQVATRWIERTIMTHTLNRRRAVREPPTARRAARPVYPWPCARRWPCRPRRRSWRLAPRRRNRFRPARPVTASRRGRWRGAAAFRRCRGRDGAVRCCLAGRARHRWPERLLLRVRGLRPPAGRLGPGRARAQRRRLRAGAAGRRDEPGSRARRGRGQPPAPAWQSSTDRKRLDELQVRNWSDFGRRVEPGVNFNRLTNSINIRGLDQDRVLTRVDGIRLPWLDDGARGVKGGLESVDFNSLSRLDIVRGADASGSGGGSGAISGIADLRTLNPSDLLEDGKRSARWPRPTTTPPTAAGAPTRRWPARSMKTLSGWCRPACATGTRWTTAATWAATARANQPTPGLQPAQPPAAAAARGRRPSLRRDRRVFQAHGGLRQYVRTGRGRPICTARTACARKPSASACRWTTAQAPSDGGLLDTVTAALYWQRVSLDTRQTAVRGVDPRAFIIPRDPFRYGFSGPYGRDNSIRQTMYSVNAEAKRLGGAVTQLWTVGGEWYGNKTEQQSSGYDNCPVIRQHTRAVRPARLRHAAHQPGRRAAVKGSQWAIWVQDEFGFADGRYADAGAALRPLQAEARGTRQLRQQSQCRQAALGQQRRPLLAQAAGRLEGGRRTQPVRAMRLWLQGAQPVPALHQLHGGAGLSARGQSLSEAETSKGWELGAKLGSDDLGGAVVLRQPLPELHRHQCAAGLGSPQWQPGWAGQYPLGVTGTVNRARVLSSTAPRPAHWKFATGWRTWGSLAWAVEQDEGTGQHLNSVAPLKAIVGLGYGRDAWGVDAMLTARSSAMIRWSIRTRRPRRPTPISRRRATA